MVTKRSHQKVTNKVHTRVRKQNSKTAKHSPGRTLGHSELAQVAPHAQSTAGGRGRFPQLAPSALRCVLRGTGIPFGAGRTRATVDFVLPRLARRTFHRPRRRRPSLCVTKRIQQ